MRRRRIDGKARIAALDGPAEAGRTDLRRPTRIVRSPTEHKKFRLVLNFAFEGWIDLASAAQVVFFCDRPKIRNSVRLVSIIFLTVMFGLALRAYFEGLLSTPP